MTQMTPAQARVIDPILTDVARGYVNEDFVGTVLFPIVTVRQRGGNMIEFGKEHFRMYNTERAPGARVAQVTGGYSGRPYALRQHAIEETVPVENAEDAQRVPGVDLGSVAVRRGMNIILRRLEKQIADLARDPTAYDASHVATLSGTSQWSDFANSDPIDAVEAAKEVVRQAIGKRPNVMVMGAAVFAKLKQHPKIVERIKYTSRDVATPELVASLFGLQRVAVGDAVYLDESDTMQDVWGKDAILAYSERGSLAQMGTPSFAYTYRLEGHPVTEEPYYDPKVRSWMYQVLDENAPVIVGPDAGYLFRNAVA